MTTYTIATNPDFNSIEITFPGKPSEAIREALKALRFRWHGVKKVWYGYTTEETARQAIENAEGEKPTEAKKPAAKAEKVNKYGVKVGDIFDADWGWEQTNVNFFQVVALVGETSVRVREVYLDMIEDSPVSPMASDRTYKLTRELLPPASRATFIKDQENGDVKRIKQCASGSICFNVSSYATAFKCNGETVKTYESWYA
jgi:hypothetical protein